MGLWFVRKSRLTKAMQEAEAWEFKYDKLMWENRDLKEAVAKAQKLFDTVAPRTVVHSFTTGTSA